MKDYKIIADDDDKEYCFIAKNLVDALCSYVSKNYSTDEVARVRKVLKPIKTATDKLTHYDIFNDDWCKIKAVDEIDMKNKRVFRYSKDSIDRWIVDKYKIEKII